MTIAACYLSSEGVVLGADSTSTIATPLGDAYYFNNNQKLFELGENSTVGVVTWGLGALGAKSYRTLLALLADDLQRNPPADLAAIAERWIDQFWIEYKAWLDSTINSLMPFNATEFEQRAEMEYRELIEVLVVGFCIAGYWLPDRTPAAYEIVFHPLGEKPSPKRLRTHYASWGISNLVSLAEEQVKASLPIRDTIDFVHTCIYSTIKLLKFSRLHRVCGGPIELAVITTDRRFRWVKHKPWDSAIEEYEHETRIR
jgi:hypothetical protein